MDDRTNRRTGGHPPHPHRTGFERWAGTPPPFPRLRRDERGAATAEYAVATLAAVGFAGLLVVIMRSDEVRQMLTDVIRAALTLPG